MEKKAGPTSIASTSSRFMQPLHDRRGQAAVEYLVVTAALISALITVPSIYKEISGTMKNKYKSYSFGIAISDPPSKEFDDKVNHDIDKVKGVIDKLKEIEEFIENLL